LDTGPGDEVIIPPYTFVATYNVVVLNYALPVFVDTDLESFQIDAKKIEAAITPQTKAIMPVHIGGYPVDLDAILGVILPWFSKKIKHFSRRMLAYRDVWDRSLSHAAAR
jgi:dTDP-4-amino-4,6-dideoxygalactose transaminase